MSDLRAAAVLSGSTDVKCHTVGLYVCFNVHGDYYFRCAGRERERGGGERREERGEKGHGG